MISPFEWRRRLSQPFRIRLGQFAHAEFRNLIRCRIKSVRSDPLLIADQPFRAVRWWISSTRSVEGWRSGARARPSVQQIILDKLLNDRLVHAHER